MYDELVKHLRFCGKCNDSMECDYCEYYNTTEYVDRACSDRLMLQAADAIEELNKRNCELLFQVCQAEALIDYYQTGRMVSNEPPKED